MKPTPGNWPRFASAVVYRDAAKAIDWLCAAFGFQVRIKVAGEDGKIVHSELEYGDGLIMVAQEAASGGRDWRASLKSPASVGGANTQTLMFYVDDALAHCENARAHGARIAQEPSVQDYGAEYWADRSYGAFDPEGHFWWISERLRSAPAPAAQ